MDKHGENQAIKGRVEDTSVDQTCAAADYHTRHDSVENGIESIDKGPVSVRTITCSRGIQTAEIIHKSILNVTLQDKQSCIAVVITISSWSIKTFIVNNSPLV